MRPLLENIDGGTVFQGYGGNKLGATLDYLDRKDLASILSSPRIVVQDGEEATFENSVQVPYVSSSTYTNYVQQTNTTTYNPRMTNRIEFLDVGTVLTVTPRVTETDTVLLEVSAEDSTYTYREIIANDQKSTVPEKTAPLRRNTSPRTLRRNHRAGRPAARPNGQDHRQSPHPRRSAHHRAHLPQSRP